jgi:hypothetical protein
MADASILARFSDGDPRGMDKARCQYLMKHVRVRAVRENVQHVAEHFPPQHGCVK